ncbi:MAG: UbiA family prenyltransferase [Pseudomonadota bacterium]
MSAVPSAGVLLSLGRVSNLPTVWTNTIAATVLAGGSLFDVRVPILLLAMTLFYVGGMYLNDAFDAEIDARERPERPIPAGLISRQTVFTAGFAMLAAGILFLALVGLVFPGETGSAPMFAGLALAAAIIFYDWYHKANPLSPVVMGLCRVLVYIAVATAFVATPPAPVLTGAVLILCYLIGLTYVAKQENLGQVENMWPLAFLAAPLFWGLFPVGEAPWSAVILAGLTAWILYALRFVVRRGPGDIPKAVVSLIAGISLLDALLVAQAGQFAVACLCILGFIATLVFQRYIAGT